MDYTVPNMFSGSILDLEPGTEYECRLVMTDPDGVSGEAEQTVTPQHALRTAAVRQRPGAACLPSRLERSAGGTVIHRSDESLPGRGRRRLGSGGRAQGAARDMILVHAGRYKSERTSTLTR